jgi:hypothetical protein
MRQEKLNTIARLPFLAASLARRRPPQVDSADLANHVLEDRERDHGGRWARLDRRDVVAA